MKKLIIGTILLSVLFMLSGCVKTVDLNGIERTVDYGLVEVSSVSGNGDFRICYDPTTMICYMKICGMYRLAVSPYYIIGNDGKPELAIYGQNYFGDQP